MGIFELIKKKYFTIILILKKYIANTIHITFTTESRLVV